MPNEKVSQMTVLTAAEVASDDIFLVGDVSANESKKITSDQLLTFIESSGSFIAVSAGIANTASYILGSNVDGAVDSASFASFVLSSSHALRANFASTASFFSASVGSVFTTASFLLYTAPSSNGTASYALTSGTSLTSTTAANLSYTGAPNGTASYAMSSSFTVTASYARTASYSVTSSFATTASFVTTSSFSHSSSVSISASYAPASVTFGPTFITPVTVYSSAAAVAFTTFDCTPYVPAGTRVILIDGYVVGNNTTVGYVYIRQDPVSPSYILTTYLTGVGDSGAVGSQGMFPITTAGLTVQYSATQAVGTNITIRLIGYF
jgi:hypothetical protein